MSDTPRDLLRVEDLPAYIVAEADRQLERLARDCASEQSTAGKSDEEIAAAVLRCRAHYAVARHEIIVLAG